MVDRWGRDGGFVKFGIDPQEDALRAGDIDAAAELAEHEGIIRDRATIRAILSRAGAHRPGATGTSTIATSPTTSSAGHRWR